MRETRFPVQRTEERESTGCEIPVRTGEVPLLRADEESAGDPPLRGFEEGPSDRTKEGGTAN